MFKQALYTYWTSLHPRNLKYIIEKRWYTFILVLVLLPDLKEIQTYGAGAFYPATIFLPIVIMKMSNLVQKINIPKALFLSPMQEAERKTYVKCLIGIKVAASMLLGVVIQFMWSMFYPLSIEVMLICLFINFSYGIADYFCVEGTLDDGSKIEHGVRGADGKITVSSCNRLAIAGVILMYMGFTPIEIPKELGQTIWGEPGVTIILALILILDIIIVIRQYRDMINTVCNFEPVIQSEK